jgi:hypothetical protein
MVYFLDPLGRVLYSGPTPYTHESHPYSLGLVTLVDGETWGMIEDIIDPQRLVNRITTAIDYMFGASSKGVLMVPEDSIPENMTADDFASEWTKFNGVIRYKAKPGVPQPQQVVQNSIPVGLFDWLNIQQQNIMNISAVNGPSLGQTPPSGTPASLYYQQVQQASINNRDYFDSFFETRRQRDLKVCKTFIQYWDDMRYLGVAGRRADGKTTITFDPARVKDFEFDIIISDSPDTPAARQLMEEYLTNLLQQNRLTFKQYLQLSSHPKADVILAVIEKTNPLLAQQQLGAAEQQALAQQLQLAAQSGDQDAIALLQQAK